MYQITITKIDKNVPFRNKEYQEVGLKENGDKDYGYVYFDDTEDVSTKVYDQTVKELDLPSVIAVVNNLSKEKQNGRQR